MRIWANTNGMLREAYRVNGDTFRCFPPSNNDDATEFATVTDAAMFLVKNQDWGIAMNPGMTVIYCGINISLD